MIIGSSAEGQVNEAKSSLKDEIEDKTPPIKKTSSEENDKALEEDEQKVRRRLSVNVT